MGKKIFVAFSGGVDSTAVLLMEKLKGNDVTAFTMDWIPEDFDSYKYGEETIKRAEKIAYSLEVPFKTVNIKKEFNEKIIKYFANEYFSGRTPNPCVLCNREIKFGLLFEKAREEGADILLTGHYLKKVNINGNWFLKRGNEPRIEQSYFLAMVKQDVFDFVDFPLGNLTRKEVENFLTEHNVKLLPKSQEICFVNENYGALLNKIKGDFNGSGFLIGPNKEKLRKHDGFYNFTIGQRKGLRVGYGKPIYVSSIDPVKGNVFTDYKENLYKSSMKVNNVNWWREPEKGETLQVQIRYRSKPVYCKIEGSFDGKVDVSFLEPQIVVPGQLAAFYDGDILIGGGWIDG